jgi:hypothetical protein
LEQISENGKRNDDCGGTKKDEVLNWNIGVRHDNWSCTKKDEVLGWNKCVRLTRSMISGVSPKRTMSLIGTNE